MSEIANWAPKRFQDPALRKWLEIFVTPSEVPILMKQHCIMSSLSLCHLSKVLQNLPLWTSPSEVVKPCSVQCILASPLAMSTKSGINLFLYWLGLIKGPYCVFQWHLNSDVQFTISFSASINHNNEDNQQTRKKRNKYQLQSATRSKLYFLNLEQWNIKLLSRALVLMKGGVRKSLFLYR